MTIETSKTITWSPKPKCSNVWLVESLDLDLYAIYSHAPWGGPNTKTAVMMRLFCVSGIL